MQTHPHVHAHALLKCVFKLHYIEYVATNSIARKPHPFVNSLCDACCDENQMPKFFFQLT